MTKLKTITDNSNHSKKLFVDKYPKLSEFILNQTLTELEKQKNILVYPHSFSASNDLDEQVKFVETLNEKVIFQNVIGFIGMDDEQLNIKSRFSHESEDYFLHYLLQKNLNLNVVNLDTNLSMEEQLYRLLIYLFPKYLNAAMRKGIFKRYRRFYDNDANIKGNIDISRHIKENTPFVGNIAYTHREFSNDNSLMQLVRHTIEYIRNSVINGRTILNSSEITKQNISLIVESTPSYNNRLKRGVIIANKDTPIRHAYYTEYKALQQLCLMILTYKHHSIGGQKNRINGILFDVAWLWEEYVNTLIGDFFYHPMNKSGEGVHWLFSKPAGKIYPDFIGRDSHKRIIADAKYKPFQNIKNKDYLQILAYMFRFDSKKGMFIYPESGESEQIEFKLYSGSRYENNQVERDDISVIKTGLIIPNDANSYDDFVTQMENSEKLLLKVFY